MKYCFLVIQMNLDCSSILRCSSVHPSVHPSNRLSTHLSIHQWGNHQLASQSVIDCLWMMINQLITISQSVSQSVSQGISFWMYSSFIKEKTGFIKWCFVNARHINHFRAEPLLRNIQMYLPFPHYSTLKWYRQLTHLPFWHIHVYASVNWVSMGSDNGLPPMLSIRLLGTNFSEILIKIQNFLFMKILLKISSAKWQPFCPAGDELKSFLIEEKDSFILYVECHGCWCPGEARIQGISSHGIGLLLPEYSVFSTRRVNI